MDGVTFALLGAVLIGIVGGVLIGFVWGRTSERQNAFIAGWAAGRIDTWPDPTDDAGA